MSNNLPIKFNEVLQLTSIGVDPSSIGFKTVTMESDKYICVCEKSNENATQVAIIDLNNPSQVNRRPISADAVIMNPKGGIIGLRAGLTIQLFNIDQKKKIKSHSMNTNVVFWKWISQYKIAIITSTDVLHWSIDDDSAPTKIFELNKSIIDSQIINYRTNDELTWLIVISIASKENRIAGNMQLYSTEKKASQIIEGHAAVFCMVKLFHNPEKSNIISFSVKSSNASLIHFIELGQPAPKNTPFPKRNVELFFPPEASDDFPVAMQCGEKFGVVYLITKRGFIYIYDIESAACLYMNRISSDTIFVTCPHDLVSGILGVNKKGQVLSISVDETTIISHIENEIKNPELAIRFASKNNLEGSEELIVSKFNRFCEEKRYEDAIKLAASAPQGMLRTEKNIQYFKSLPNQPGKSPWILQYFALLLERSTLNETESIEICQIALSQDRSSMIEKWLKENKLQYTEKLGDVISQYNLKFAMSIYLRAECPSKVISCMAKTGQYKNIIIYADKIGLKPDYAVVLNDVIEHDASNSIIFANMLIESGQLTNVRDVAELFVRKNMIKEFTAFLLEALKNNDPNDGPLQTMLLEVNLKAAPKVADAIMGNNMFSYYDRPTIAGLCESAGLIQRAIEHYTDIYDIKHALVNANQLNVDWVIQFFNTLNVENSFDCIKEMLSNNLQLNLKICIKIAVKYHQELGPLRIVELLESYKTYEALYYFLGSIINSTEDSELHFKFIEAACKTGQTKELERVCRESKFYDGERVKNFLKSTNLTDLLPLIIVCDRFDYIQELILHLYRNDLVKYIEIFVTKVNSERLPEVVGALLDVNCQEDTIKNLLVNVHGVYSTKELVEAVEKRNRLNILQSFFENKVYEGVTDPETHNALAKIYIDTANGAERFLKENEYYDSVVVGKYCEKRNPMHACIAYERGNCDNEMIQVCNDNALFKNLARYCVKRQNEGLWGMVLSEENGERNCLIEIIQIVLPEIRSSDEITVAVKAFMAAKMPGKLIEILEKVVMENSTFKEHGNLQNLLILTAVKSEPSRVMDYVSKLENYHAKDIAKIVLDHHLYEEAFIIYSKFNAEELAIKVLVDDIKNMDRGHEYAEKCNNNAVWSYLAKGQLTNNKIKEAINGYIRSNDYKNNVSVVEFSKKNGNWDDLVRYLQMCIENVRETFIETEYCYALAKVNKITEMEIFTNAGTHANLNDVADRCYNDKIYEASLILYKNISNFPKLALTYVHLGMHQEAVEIGRKANNTNTWKELCYACLEIEEYRLAQICGLCIIIHAEEMEEVINVYLKYGYVDELITLLEAGLSLDRSHMGIFTQVAILYSQFRTNKLYEHLKIFASRVNIPLVVKAVKEAELWLELVYLYDKYDEYDNSVITIMEYPIDTWRESHFKDTITKVINVKLYFKAIQFYLDYKPLLLNDLMIAIAPRLDATEAISFFKKLDKISYISTYLKSIQHRNIVNVNETLNSIYVDGEDINALEISISQFQNFNAIKLADQLKIHELIAFRKIAAKLYKNNNRWKQAIDLCKRDKFFKDAISYVSQSGNIEQTEELISWFLENKEYESFTACLYKCYHLLRLDVVMELSWKHDIMNYCMPFFIQSMRDMTLNVKKLEKNEEDRSVKEKNDNKHNQLNMIQSSNLMLTDRNGASNNLFKNTQF